MVRQFEPNCAVVEASELGTNCWHPCRFIEEDGRCPRVWTCSYPKKNKCQAIHAEIAHIKDEQKRLLQVSSNLDERVEQLAEMLPK
jgi:hypothetical protein